VGVGFLDSSQKKVSTRLDAKPPLIEVNRNRGRGDAPREMHIKKPLNNSHKVNLASFAEETAE
jgi:hypothetical protein